MQQPLYNVNPLLVFLKPLREDPNIISITLVSRDGLMISQGLPGSVDERLVAPMAAAMVGTSEQLSSQLQFREMKATMIYGDAHNIISVTAGPQFILIALVKRRADPRPIITKLRRVANKIRRYP